ncbi:accessory Sec system protein Asp2 [Neobacillus niacini]|uniref:accessory Sec system protein Asp2 n=1 Tax=Neobacillus niacini TaxID=86668 RepID=UPI0027D92019|nr:accessory Sec system protein Asp2 [Neobacillus niacini]
MYNSNLPIKYIVKEGRINKDYLLVVFSGFSEINAERKHAYNYMTPLKNLDCNKLFILDNYGPTGCYYFGENMNLEVESSVMSLITNIIRKNKIRYENVITAGSSKGGSAALYFGLKYNFGAVFAGAFQSKIADLISFRRPEAYKYLLGEEPNPTGHQMLNNIIYKQLNKEIFTKLYLISSKKDWQHPEHIQPFLNTLEEKQIPYLYYECEEMVDHSDIGRHFPDFFNKTSPKYILFS